MSRIQSHLHGPIHRLIELPASRRNSGLFRAPGHYNQSMLRKSLMALCVLLASLGSSAGREAELQKACGVRVGEVTGDSVIVWTRVTLHSSHDREGLPTFAQRRTALQ